MRNLSIAVCALLSLCLLTGAARRRSVRSTNPIPVLNLERSFAITDRVTLAPFRFERVLDALVARSNVPGMTAEKLFRQWFDTQNPKPGLDASMPHCNDEMTNGKPSLNGFQQACPADGGFLANAPFQPDELIPIAITNRFDQATGANCGQYRIAYALKRGAPQDTFHVIFEAALPNPDPSGDLASCRPVAQFWADLSGIASRDERRVRLEQFFFEGLDGFAPVFDPDNYHIAPAGIRTLQLTAPQNLLHFFQYRLIRECGSASSCKLYMKPDVLENTVFGGLFDAHVTTPQAVAFREDFVKQVKTLVIPNVNLYTLNIPAQFLVPDTQPTLEDEQPSFVGAFTAGLSTTAGLAFRDAIEAESRKAGSTLGANLILTRVITQNCAGCHFGGIPVGDGINFPLAIRDFQQVTEDQIITGEGGPASRFAISGAMSQVFIPHRMQILRDYLATGKAPVHSN